MLWDLFFDSAWHRDCNMSKLHHESVSDVMVEFCMFDSLMWKNSCKVNRCRKNWNCLFSNVSGMWTFTAFENSTRISFVNSFSSQARRAWTKTETAYETFRCCAWCLDLSVWVAWVQKGDFVLSREILITVLRCFRLLAPSAERN
jgi:hypothetical protein